MNKGIRMATGDVVGLLNSDDFYTSNDVIEHVVKALSDPTWMPSTATSIMSMTTI